MNREYGWTVLRWAVLLVAGGMLAVMICTTAALVVWFSYDVAAGLRRVVHRARCRRAWSIVVADALDELQEVDR